MDSKSATGIEKTQTIFLEGQNMIKDAVNAGVELKSVYATEKILLERLQLGGGVNQYLTRNKALKDWVSKQAVQSDGIICGKLFYWVIPNYLNMFENICISTEFYPLFEY